MKVTVSQLLQDVAGIFSAARFLILVGRPGGAKTSLANPIGEITGREVWVLNFSGSGPCEVSGYGVPHEAPKSDDEMKHYDMAFAAPDVLPLLRRVGNKPIILVLDEFSDWPPAIQSLFRGVFDTGHGKMVGTHQLGTDVAIMITGNTREHGSKLSAVIPAPVINRGVRYELDPNVADWQKWFANKYSNSLSPVPAFLSYGQTQVNKEDGEHDHFCPPVPQPWDGGAYPSPRAWEAVALFDDQRKENPASFARMVRGTVGDAAADAFLAFAAHATSIPEVDKLIAGEIDFPEDAAEAYGMANAILIKARTQCPADESANEMARGNFDWLAKLISGCPRRDLAKFMLGACNNYGIEVTQHKQLSELWGAMHGV